MKGGFLALLAIAGFVAPAMACRTSHSVFTADPGSARGATEVRVRVKVEESLLLYGRQLIAVRATLPGNSGIARREESIVIVVPSPGQNCYFGELADPAAIAGDGSLEGYVALRARREPSGAFSSWLAGDADRSRYNRFAEGRIRGQWVRARFRAGDD